MSKKKTEVKKTSFYQKEYKKLYIIPIILFIFSIISIVNTINVDGTPINRDVSLKGGLSAIIETTTISSEEFGENIKEEFSDNSFLISDLEREGNIIGFVVDTDLDEEIFMEYTSSVVGVPLEFGDNYSSNFISPTLSLSFFKQAIMILIISFILMSAVIFFYFKELVPSGAVVLSALFDIVVTVGILNAMDVKIGIAGIGALLMIIGYSIDTDVLLTNRMYKENLIKQSKKAKPLFNLSEDEIYDKMKFSFTTGLLMTGTTLAAGIGAMILTNSDIIFQIALILVVGLIVDFISTWFTNAGILFHWLKKKTTNK